MVAAKKNQKDSKGREGLARRASGLLSKPVTAVTTGALERALLAEFPAADAEPWDRTGMSVGDFLFRPDRSRWGWTMPYARRAG